MRSWGKAKSKNSRIRVAERRNRAAPILPIGVGSPAHTCDLDAVGTKAGTELAFHDAGVESFEGVGGR
jgi:hypothetical protein